MKCFQTCGHGYLVHNIHAHIQCVGSQIPRIVGTQYLFESFRHILNGALSMICINALLSNSPLQQDMWPIYISHWFSRCYHEEMWKLKKYLSFWPWTKYNLCVDILVCEIKIVQIKCSLYFHCPKALHLVQFEKHTFSSFRTIQGNTAILCYTLYATFLSLFLLQIWFNLIARTCLEFSVCRESLHVS